jgi:hypothetical protein
MRGLQLARLAGKLGWSLRDIEELERFRDELVERVVAVARPPSET